MALHSVASWCAATAAFPIPAGVYDLLVENCDEETATEEYELDISEATAYQIGVAALPAASPPEAHASAAARS